MKGLYSYVNDFGGADAIGLGIRLLPPVAAKWRTRLQPIRTASEISIRIIVKALQRIPLYQKVAKKVAELYLLGMTYKEITKSLHIARNTVKKASKFYSSHVRRVIASEAILNKKGDKHVLAIQNS